MNWKILILVFGFALIGTAGTAQACEARWFNTSAETTLAAANNPVLPPVASPANPGAGASACGPGSQLSVYPILAWTHKIKAFIDPRIIEKSCLASAVYFEARSEPQAGQMAVAMVILNRTKAPHYPSSICGVVYQGASRLNACQFSFACDGKPDLAQDSSAWEAAIAVTTLALAGDRQVKNRQMQMVSTATHYHADYVEPHWSKSLHRLAKIGHHIFYSQG